MVRRARKRRHVSSRVLLLLRPFVRFSVGRDAYVLRFIGSSYGPVLVTETMLDRLAAELPEAAAVPERPPARGQRFVRRADHRSEQRTEQRASRS